MNLPWSDTAVYGGLTGAQRQRARTVAAKAARDKATARRDAQRRYGRNSERLRRQLGKAPATSERYADDPEPFKRQAARYYEQHKQEILARRRAARKQRKAAAAA